MKNCTKCGELKALNQFYKQENKPMSRCMDCVRSIYKKRYYAVIKPRTIEEKRKETTGLYGVKKRA